MVGRAHNKRSAETCGNVHWLKGHSVDLEATSERYTPSGAPAAVTVSKTECSRQPSTWLNVKAWNDKGSTFGPLFVGSLSLARGILRPITNLVVHSLGTGWLGRSGINRSTGGYGYLRASGEILRPLKDRHQRKHLAIVLSLIKDERSGIEED